MFYDIPKSNRFNIMRWLFLSVMIMCCLFALHAIENDLMIQLTVMCVFIILFLSLFILFTLLRTASIEYYRILDHHDALRLSDLGRNILIKQWYASNEFIINLFDVRPLPEEDPYDDPSTMDHLEIT